MTRRGGGVDIREDVIVVQGVGVSMDWKTRRHGDEADKDAGQTDGLRLHSSDFGWT